MENSLNRFLKAQNADYEIALTEIKSGKKRSHWMWYIFPQIQGLGCSETAKYYEIQNKKEAVDFLNHPILGKRIREITGELIKLQEDNPTTIFGHPDDLKLKSSMTLFSLIESKSDNIFEDVIKKFYNGNYDEKTLQILKNL